MRWIISIIPFEILIFAFRKFERCDMKYGRLSTGEHNRFDIEFNWMRPISSHSDYDFVH